MARKKTTTEITDKVIVPKASTVKTIDIKIPLTDEQKKAKERIFRSKISVLTGKPGTSKTFLACNIALDLMKKGVIDKIIITRATVESSNKSMGYLPGEGLDPMSGKMAPYMTPIIQALIKLSGDEKLITYLVNTNKIQVVPVQFARGLNFENCCVLLDESQNFTYEELKVLTTRLCKDAKMIFTSDVNQIDLKNKYESASRFFEAISHLDGVSMIELTENFRDPLAIQIMEVIDHLLDEENFKKRK